MLSLILFIIGGITILIGIIIGVMSGAFLGFIVSVFGSISAAVIFFALAVILDKQDDILAKLSLTDQAKRKLIDQTTCARCEKEYDEDRASCPHCAYKPK